MQNYRSIFSNQTPLYKYCESIGWWLLIIISNVDIMTWRAKGKHYKHKMTSLYCNSTFRTRKKDTYAKKQSKNFLFSSAHIRVKENNLIGPPCVDRDWVTG